MRYLAICLCLLGTLSCKTETKTCEPAQINLNFVGFGESINVNATSYKKNGMFDSLVEIIHIPTGLTREGSDTIMCINYLSTDYDYRIALANTNITYEIKNITVGNHYTQKFRTSIFNTVDFGCTNNTTSLMLDGKLIGDPANPNGSYRDIYIHK